jgi:hypothetical protein
MKKNIILLVLFMGILSIASCGSGTSSNDTDEDATPGLTFETVADFDASASAAISALIKKTTTGVCADLDEPIEVDDPMLADGLDCDEDSGVVTHITPSKYSLALKRVSMLAEDGTDIDLIPDTGTLAEAEVINFTPENLSETIIDIDAADLVGGTYTGLEFEIYYFQLTFAVAGTSRNVRFYMSDDDFVSEGSLGHHQGDVTFVADDGTELGWIDGTWSAVSDSRDVQEGAGGEDAETGHIRGFFGNTDLWDDDDQMQGAEQDIFVYNLPFSLPIPLPEPAENDERLTITTTFSVADTFFYEDFDNPTLDSCSGFCPEEGGEAGLANAEWAPLTPTAILSKETVSGLPMPLP